jgi:KDO2-lipid IV(A) lauroyltransferase
MSLARLVEYLLIRALLSILQSLPYEGAVRFGRLLGDLGYWVAVTPRRRVEANLRLAFGGALDRKEEERIAREVFQNIGRHVAELAHLPRRRTRGFSLENGDVLQDAYRLGKGVILVSAHLGSFARLIVVPGLLGIPASAILKRQKNLRLLQWLIGQMKRHFRLDVVLKSDAVDQIGSELKRGRMVGFFADQHPIAGGFDGSFFGRPVQVAKGPALYAKRYGSPIVLITLQSSMGGHHVARCEGPVSADGTLEEISQRWLDLIEARIREHPEQWMWMHRRWR